MPRLIHPAALAAALLLAGAASAQLPDSAQRPASAQRPDWDALADVETLHVVTHDEDGAPRETKIWLAVVDGQGFIRTGATTWGDNVERDRNLVLRIEGVEYELRVEFIENEALRDRVTGTFREKYGFTDALLSLFRGGHPRIMHMIPR